MLNVIMALIVITVSYKLDAIHVNVGPVVSFSKDFVCQGLSSKVTPTNAFMDLMQDIINLNRLEVA